MPDILISELKHPTGSLGVITLNRPQALNALSLSMIDTFIAQLQTWQEDHHIKGIFLESAGSAFCSGGDLRALYINRHHPEISLEYFKREYTLNRLIFHFKKPYCSFLDGLTLGGGAGISVHGSFRVATENFLFGMPETGIGFFPDVGMGFVLARLPYHFGYYLALTGLTISSETARALGIVTCFIKSEMKTSLLHTLQTATFSAENLADLLPFSFLNGMSIPHQETIDEIFSGDTLETILERLEKHQTPWAENILTILKRRSPTSLKITFQHLKNVQTKNFDDAIAEDLKLTASFLTEPDFYEGIRAAIIDKDKTPVWHPPQLNEVSEHKIKTFFNPPIKF